MNAYKENALNTLAKLVSFKTVKGQPQINAPFGEELKKCLDYFLDLGKSLGFTVKNVDGYAGHVEWKGQSDEIVGILAHLDVVPEGEGWLYPPYKATIEGDYMYGRGVLDDKGPAAACLYAMKELKDSGFIPTKTIRLIVGCDEESGWEDIEYFKTKSTFPEYGFSPDGDFPVSYAEKGINNICFSLPKLKNFYDIKGGTVFNAVCGYATCKAKKEGINLTLLKKHGLNLIDDNTIESVGKSCHGSRPELGKNAIKPLF
ncbi:MAG: Sapep family Mn(2+)-dependent dipeptidase, partial [Clostridia bacterium]|nr:Sapep family Mn(2+)-dependent dipeptidase [Clostridia bacterium]